VPTVRHHLALVNAEDGEIVSKKVGEEESHVRMSGQEEEEEEEEFRG
jgi:hypothetical protein